jgi:hypothetical protein
MSQLGFRSRARRRLGRHRTVQSATKATLVMLFPLLVSLLVAGCSNSTQSTANPYHLLSAKYPDCQQQGEVMARYLDTGQPTLYDSFGWTDQRQSALSLSGVPKTTYIRQQANAFIRQCDSNLATQKASEPVAEQEALAALQTKEESTCEGVSATWRWGVCYIAYTSPNDDQVYYYTVSFDDQGNIAPGEGPQNADQCAHYGENISTQWHPDTDVCSL